MRELVELIVKSLVKNPDNVEVVETQSENNIDIVVTVPADEMGRVIGKNGRTAMAIRTVARTCAKKTNKRLDVKFEKKA